MSTVADAIDVANPVVRAACGADGRNRWRVRQLAAARVVSAGGTQAAQVALVYQIYAVTHSGAWVAAVMFASITAGGLVGPLSGWLADRFDRRCVMVASELGAGLVYLAMLAARAPEALVAGALAATVVGAPFRAASAAAIPNLVELHDLPWANGVLGAAFNIALVAGPFLGGALVAASGVRVVFAVNAATFGASAVLIGSMQGAFSARAHRVDNGRERLASFAGFGLLVRHPLLAPLAAASTLAFGAFGAAVVIDPALAHAFHAGSIGYGLLTSGWGGGAVLGAIVAGRAVRVDWAPRAVLLGMIAMAISLGAIVVLPNLPLIVAAGAIGGVGNGFVFIPWLLLIQHHAVDAVRGRVIAASEAFDQVGFLAGMGLAVPMIAVTGAQHAYAVPGVLLALAALAATAAMRFAAGAPSPPAARDRDASDYL